MADPWTEERGSGTQEAAAILLKRAARRSNNDVVIGVAVAILEGRDPILQKRWWAVWEKGLEIVIPPRITVRPR